MKKAMLTITLTLCVSMCACMCAYAQEMPQELIFKVGISPSSTLSEDVTATIAGTSVKALGDNDGADFGISLATDLYVFNK